MIINFVLLGTGKSQVIAECIYQLLVNQPSARILVCAQSNDVVNELSERLLHYIRTYKQTDCGVPMLFRFIAESQRDRNVNAELLDISNLVIEGDYFQKCTSHRVVLSTLSVSGRLALNAEFPKQYFTHLFIDECEAATEPMALLPISCVCSSSGKINVRICLAGDAQQLGPFVKDDRAKGYGS